MTGTYSMIVGAYNGPQNREVWIPGSITYHVGITYSSPDDPVRNFDPYQGTFIDCKIKTVDPDNQAVLTSHSFTSITLLNSHELQRTDRPFDLIVHVAIRFTHPGTIQLSFSLRESRKSRKIAKGQFPVPKLTAVSLDQLSDRDHTKRLSEELDRISGQSKSGDH